MTDRNKKIFHRFLVDNKALIGFQNNYRKHKFTSSRNMTLQDYLEKVTASCAIIQAFDWFVASEKAGFWNDLDAQWEKHITNSMINDRQGCKFVL